MSNSLFRQQAIEAKANTLMGQSYLISPLRFKVIAVLALGTAIAFLSIAFLGSYTKKETVAGYVTTTEANVRVFSTSGGVISDLYVADGDLVKSGQALLRVSTSFSTSTTAAGSVQTDLLDFMRSEAASVRGQISRAHDIAASQKKAIGNRMDNTLFQIGAMKEQIEDATKRLALAEKNSTRMSDLRSRNLVSEADIDRAHAATLDHKLTLTDIKRELAMQRTVLEQLHIDLVQLPVTGADKIAVLDTALKRIHQRIAETEGREAIVVVAPIDGRISDLGRRVGQQISVDMPLLSVLPVSTDYYAEVYVPSRSMGFVREGSEIRLRYDAYPYQKYGVFVGTVIRLATTPIRPGEADAPIQLLEPSYRLVVSLDDQEASANGEALQLQAGMTLRADIVRTERRIIEWLFEPIASAVKRTQ